MITTRPTNRLARLSEFGINQIRRLEIRTSGVRAYAGSVVAKLKLQERTNHLLSRCGWHLEAGALDEVSKGYYVSLIRVDEDAKDGGKLDDRSTKIHCDPDCPSCRNPYSDGGIG